MNFIRTIAALFAGWAHRIAEAVVGGLSRLISPRSVRLTEKSDGSFNLQVDGRPGEGDTQVGFVDGELRADSAASALRASRVELRLAPSHFLFRPLELPAKAADFLDGIVGAQIDRLTPWTASAAAFGCSPPTPVDPERIATVIAVTTRAAVMPYVKALLAFQPASIMITTAEGAQTAPIKVFDQQAPRFLDVQRLSRALLVVLVATAVGALLSLVAMFLTASRLEAQQDIVTREIALIQTSMRAGAATPDEAARQLLERRKHEAPLMTIMLEALSKVLPDNTYVTELHVTGNRMQVVGFSRDAPALIGLLEQSSNFTRATFFAPTTRSPSDPGDRFHIEARVEPPTPSVK